MTATVEELSSLYRGVDSDDQSHFTFPRKPIKSDSVKIPQSPTIRCTKLNESDDQPNKRSRKHDPLDVIKKLTAMHGLSEIASCFLACAAFSAIIIKLWFIRTNHCHNGHDLSR